MATLREYFDADFSYATRVHVKLTGRPDVDVGLLYDFAAHTAFLACYLPGDQHVLQDFIQLIEAMQPGKSQVILDGRVNLPSTRMFPGQLEVRNTNPFEMRAQFFGDPEWISTNEIPTSTRVFIYSESRLSEGEISQLKQKGREVGVRVQFRDHAKITSHDM